MKMRLGDVLLFWLMLAWLTTSVGPWWVGLAGFLGAWIINRDRGRR
jgi:hypothetical protein